MYKIEDDIFPDVRLKTLSKTFVEAAQSITGRESSLSAQRQSPFLGAEAPAAQKQSLYSVRNVPHDLQDSSIYDLVAEEKQFFNPRTTSDPTQKFFDDVQIQTDIEYLNEQSEDSQQADRYRLGEIVHRESQTARGERANQKASLATKMDPLKLN